MVDEQEQVGDVELASVTMLRADVTDRFSGGGEKRKGGYFPRIGALNYLFARSLLLSPLTHLIF